MAMRRVIQEHGIGKRGLGESAVAEEPALLGRTGVVAIADDPQIAFADVGGAHRDAQAGAGHALAIRAVALALSRSVRASTIMSGSLDVVGAARRRMMASPTQLPLIVAPLSS